MVDGQGSVADVRLAEEQDTGRKKGYAFVDFVDVASAERAVKELQGNAALLLHVHLLFIFNIHIHIDIDIHACMYAMRRVYIIYSMDKYTN